MQICAAPLEFVLGQRHLSGGRWPEKSLPMERARRQTFARCNLLAFSPNWPQAVGQVSIVCELYHEWRMTDGGLR